MFGIKLPKVLDTSAISIFNVSSIGESKVTELLHKNEKIIIDYTKKSFIRTYPKGTRVDSSNYDPWPGLIIGAQVVALNFQTYD